MVCRLPKKKKRMLEGIFKVICIIIFVSISNITSVESTCPEICQCKKIGDIATNLKVKCGTQKKVGSLKEINFGELSDKIIHLNLSKNLLSYTDKNDFVNYTNLKRLDLSFNQLKIIDVNNFGEIPTLERLKISSNSIEHILPGSFEKLINLKQLDVSGNPLACDCDLLWLISWANKFQVRLQPPPRCETPLPFKGNLLENLQVGSDLHCESPLQPPLELKPETDQLVFEGDELVLRCRAPRVAVGAAKDSEDLPARSHVFWGWSERIIDPNSTEDIHYLDPSSQFPTIKIEDKHLSDSGLLDSILIIPNVTKSHSGMWDCRLRSQQANLSKSISLIVISNTTKYCSAHVVKNNKGKYFWPRTVRGKTVRIHCVGETPLEAFATYQCNTEGQWVNLNTEACPFISETTRIFQQFSQYDLVGSADRALESASHLRNYTQSDENLKKIRDPMDLVFITRTVKNYLHFVSFKKDLGTMLLDIVSQIMTLPRILCQQAQRLERTGTTLVDAVEQAAQHTSSSLTHKPHLAVEYFNINPNSFNDLICTWLKTDTLASNEKKVHQRIFQCSASQATDLFRNDVEAYIKIPINVFGSKDQKHFSTTQKLMVAFYENSNLLPYLKSNSTYQVTSNIIGVKIFSDSLIDYSGINLTDPISIRLRIRPYHNDISSPLPVWWDPTTLSWTKNGCHISYAFQGFLFFSCNRLGYYGLLQNSKYLNDFLDENAGAKFRISPLGFYIGCFILFICCWVNIVTYLSSGSAILMARRQRHALINTWLAISLLSLVFGLGIFQTEDYRFCQLFGISIHYFSLCVLLWVCVSVSNMYKRLSKRNRLPTDDLPKENVGRKPILGIYLVGWGIGLIICGISGAVNMREYASYSYCFFSNGPSLSAIFVPAIILLVFLSILFICVRCHIRIVADHHNHFSEGTQATENVDIELLESNHNGIIMNQSVYNRSITLSSPCTSIIDDSEHTNLVQLRAHFIFVLMYCISWLSAAASVATPFEDRGVLYEEEAFSMIFAIFTSLLGLFLFFFYCVTRSDVRMQWSEWSFRNFCQRRQPTRRNTKRGGCCRRTRSVSDTKEMMNPSMVYHHQTCNAATIAAANSISGSRSNSQCSKTRPGSASGNHIKTITDVNVNGAATLPRTDSPNKIVLNPNAGVAVMQRTGPIIGACSTSATPYLQNSVVASTEIPNPEIFYNPNQINVARKFFKKQKRIAKRNNFELQRQMDRGGLGGASDFCDATSDVSSTVGYSPASAITFPRESHHSSSVVNCNSQPNTNNSNAGIGNANLRGAMSMFSAGSKVNNTNIHVRPEIASKSCIKESRQSNINPNILSDSCNESDMICEAERLVLGAEGMRVLAANNRTKVNNTEMVANIYTNVPETLQPQHEIVTMKSNSGSGDESKFTRRSHNIDCLIEEDESLTDNFDGQCHNDLNTQTNTSGSDGINAPLYVNSNMRNIIECSTETSVALTVLTNAIPNISQSNSGKEITSNTLRKNSDSMIPPKEKKIQPTLLDIQTSSSICNKSISNGSDSNNSNANENLILSLNSPIVAMNTLGLPSIESDQNNSSICTVKGSNINSNEKLISTLASSGTTTSISCDSSVGLNSSIEDNKIDLSKNDAYISPALEINENGAVYQRDSEEIYISNCQQLTKSKSMLELDLNSENFSIDVLLGNHSRGGSFKSKKYDNFHETAVRSISCTNLSQVGVDGILVDVRESHFSPSEKTEEIDIKNSNKLDNCKMAETSFLQHRTSSPILFSPSLCDIDDLPSPADRRKPIVLAEDSIIPVPDDDISQSSLNNTQSGTSTTTTTATAPTTTNNNSDSLNLFSQTSLRRNFTSSPTCESDINYQNSELSIRSHGLYAPQPDNDLNLTLTGEENCFYPYQSSEISDIEDDPDFDDFNNCSNDCLLPHNSNQLHDPTENSIMLDGSQTSLDELYQRITRNDKYITSRLNDVSGQKNLNLLGHNNLITSDETTSILTDSTYDESDETKAIIDGIKQKNGENDNMESSTGFMKPPNKFAFHKRNDILTGIDGGNNIELGINSSSSSGVNNISIYEHEDDSSQGSIISYIDPNPNVEIKRKM